MRRSVLPDRFTRVGSIGDEKDGSVLGLGKETQLAACMTGQAHQTQESITKQIMGRAKG